jgi:hypothetical protein
MMKLRAFTFLLLISLSVFGCAKADYSQPAMNEAATDTMAVTDGSGSMAVADAAPPLATEAVVDRKIVYTADVDIVVEEFDLVPSQVKDLAEQHSGYIAKSDIRGRPGSPRSGEWTIRVPVANYEDFLAAAGELGETRSVRTDSDDVTSEFYDVEARIRNKKQEEDRLRKHLEDSTGKLEDILHVEREISRVRGEIERMEGRMRVLKDLTSLTTINLRVDEIKDYVPEGDPTYTTRVRRAFSGSISALVAAARAVSIAIVVAVPWLGVLLVVLVMVFMLRSFIRKLFRRTR